MPDAIAIRPARPEDEPELRRICLLTGDAGQDATALFPDPDLLSDIFAVPYLRLEPSSAFVAEDAVGICGYILGTVDTDAFNRRLELDWWPALRLRHPLPTPEDVSLPATFIRNFIHAPAQPLGETLWAYPAHLHIDLLPRGQGLGLGRRLMERFFDHLRSQGVPGVHWGVDQRNAGALAFYRRLGAQVLEVADWGTRFGYPLI